MQHTGRTMELEIETTAPPEQAWTAWADPAHISRWFTDRASGDPQPGEIVYWSFDKFYQDVPYQVVAAVPFLQYALRFAPQNRPPGLIEVRFAQSGSGTKIRLINSGFLHRGVWDEEFDGVLSGWKNALSLLKLYLESYFGRDKKTILVLRPTHFDFEELAPYFRSGEGLSFWLTKKGEMGLEGDAIAWKLRNRDKLTGKVLRLTGREAALSWSEIEGALELKAFSAGPSKRMLALRATTWSPSVDAAALEKFFQDSLDRLAECVEIEPEEVDT
ncbi:MAG: SRPBCC domain-containing protein [Bryobacteraceae bacterium]